MRNKNYSEVDKIFQSRINNDAEEPGKGWNQPPIQVFDGAMSKIKSNDEQKRRRLIIWAFGTAIILSFIGLTFWGTTKIQNINEKIDVILEKQIKETTENIVTTPITTTSQSDNTEERIADNPNSKNIINSNLHKQVEEIAFTNTSKSLAKPNKVSKSITDNVITHVASNNTFSKLLPVVDENLVSLNHTNTNILESSSSYDVPSKRNSLGPIMAIGSLKSSISSDPRALPKVDKLDLFFFTRTPSSSLAFNVFGGINLSSLSMSSPTGLSDELTEYDNWYPGFQLGLGLDQTLHSKWKLNYSISYQKIKNKSIYTSDFLYDKNKETMDTNGDLVYESMVGMDAPMGVYNRSVQINVAQEDIAHNEIMNNITHITNAFNILSLNTSLAYTILDNRKLDLYIQTGIGANYIFGMDQGMDMKLYHQNKMLAQDSFNSYAKDQLNTFYLTGFIDLGIEYQINQHIYIGINSGLSHAIQSLRKVDTSNAVKTHLNNIRSNASIGIRF